MGFLHTFDLFWWGDSWYCPGRAVSLRFLFAHRLSWLCSGFKRRVRFCFAASRARTLIRPPCGRIRIWCCGCNICHRGVRKNLKPPALGLGAKDILSPLMDTSWDVLLVGGITALVGHGLLQILVKIPVVNLFDDIALSVVFTAFLARLICYREAPWGKSKCIKECGYFGYKCQWIPWMNVPSRQVIFGLGVGLFSGALAYYCKGVLDPMAAAGKITKAGAFVVPLIMSWAIAGPFDSCGAWHTDNRAPGWDSKSTGLALSINSGRPGLSVLLGNILIAGIVGILATFLQDLMARMFWNHGSNHVDPPATAIAVGTLILNVIHKFI